MRNYRIDENLVASKLFSTAMIGGGSLFAGACLFAVGINAFGSPHHAAPVATVALFDDNSARRPTYLAEANLYSDYNGTVRRLNPDHPTDAILGESVGAILTASVNEPSQPLRARANRSIADPAYSSSKKAPKKRTPTIIRGEEANTAATPTTDGLAASKMAQKVITVSAADVQPTIRVNGKEVAIGLPKLDALENAQVQGQNISLPVPQPQLSVAQIAPQKIAMHNQARAFAPQLGRPKISIIIGGLGVNSRLTTQAIKDLPADVSLAFIPHAHNLKHHINTARKDGHEVLVEMPMEPHNYGRFKPHPQVLSVNNSPQENITRLQTVLAKSPGVFGIMNYQGGRFAQDPSAVRPVTEALKNFNIALIQDGSLPASILGQMSDETGTMFSAADVQIDARETSSDILLKLAELESIARREGHAVGAGYALPLTLDAVQKWSQDLERRGLQLVPISASLSNTIPKKVN